VILHPPAPAIQQIDLTIEAADVPGLDQEEFQDHAERAKTSCIISGALGGAGQINLSATLAR
jgi:osmotically inducible protein OsmC